MYCTTTCISYALAHLPLYIEYVHPEAGVETKHCPRICKHTPTVFRKKQGSVFEVCLSSDGGKRTKGWGRLRKEIEKKEPYFRVE